MVNLFDLSLEELSGFVCSLGEKPFRARQIYGWMYGKGVTDFSAMTDVPAAARGRLQAAAALEVLRPAGAVASADGGTTKLLFETGDGECIEAVFMRYKDRNSTCISTQAGCRMGCRFCASGALGLARNLSPGEMALQVVLAERACGARTKNIVLMGIGEPLDNYDSVRKFIENITDDHGRDLSRRAITLSTCGVVPMIDRLAAELPQVNLAVSLHAPDDVLRGQIMPVTKRWGVREVVAAAARHVEATHRRATFEYALIEGFNDAPAQANALAALLRGLNCLVNLIPLNTAGTGGMPCTVGADGNPPDTNGARYAGTGTAAAQRFREALGARGVKATVRRSLGADIEAACGQLRLRRRKAGASRPAEGACDGAERDAASFGHDGSEVLNG
ncbi:MAG: 23S rRNA (adenine(2503)-C(2))-methyltransferase RlmN [Clostridiales Family XIII bacterium]|jgi:23S rRNA (adenine2503-C2)-methyltransferase|nr:23S rRNA (adenine(2503)-C(2))-methyltransferase RlmN [Clostridiales Family XIII bacterium]